MARSKFPGKPSKPVNRTRINVLPASTIREDSILNLPKDSKLTDDDCDEVLQITNESNTSMVLNCSTQRVVRRKRVCKRIIVRRSSITKLIHTSSSNSQKFKNSITDQAHFTRKKTDKRPDREILSNRKIVKQALEGSNVVGKFVLPIRSVHSSRVIKPNKRFLNVEAVNSVRTFKKRVVNKKTSCIQRDNNLEVDTSTQDEEESADTSISRTPCSTRRIILRQARLQLHTQTPIGPEGPFSSNSSSSSNSPPGTVTCGVCGAVRFYRFVKQARKFNIYSCESCRKFISKMIKRQMCNKKLNEVQCLKGQGVCHVPPIVRSQHWKFRCAYKARCNACWLKMCLRSFQMPSSLKINLVNLLPKFMRESDTLFNNSISLFSFHTNSKTVIKPLSSSFMDSGKVDSLPLRKRPLRKVPAKNLEKLSLSLISNIKRQKVDFKGPRVKHVCRSASIVLGQPLAIFPDESNTTRVEVVENGVINVNSPTVTNGINILGNKEKDVLTERQGTELKVNISNSSEIETKNSTKIQPQISSTVVKREKDKNKLPAILNGDDDSRKRQRELENNICVDFWENYDLEEVYQNGFGLISSVSFPMLAICFLCGSSGCDPLLFCCLCCEPYHPFCLEQIPQNIKANEKCYDWLCPRCTMCSTCGQTDKQKFNCQKCYKAYHLECFNTKLQTEDRPKVCSSCLRCRSCGKNNITKFIGNTPLCLMCFRLRNKGNFCPICQRCYDEKDYDTKMMECGKCNKWIHSKCEGLSEEQYQILSLLPESIEFMCCLCESKPIWRKAVDVELRSNFNAVLRLLSKNRVARNILKWSPVCCSPRISKNVISARKLQFSDDSDMCDSEEEDSSELSKRCKQKFKSKEARVVSKACGAEENVSSSSLDDKVPLKTINTLTDIKNKLSCKEYFSLKEFNESMEEIVKLTKSSKLLEIYNSIMKQIFPWYDSNLNDSDYLNTSFCDVSQIVTKSEDIKGSLDYCRFKLANNIDVDIRICSLCKAVGDGVYYEEGRLLYCGNNEWIHANCAMWSSEVYEEIDGSLQNVQSAIIRGRSIRCTYCKQKGASIGCCAKSCHETYHFLCAQTVKCHFMHDKSIYCPSHNVIKNSAVISSSSDFAINRSIYVELDKKKKRFTESKKIQFMVGSLCVTSIGNVVPTLSDNSEAIIPLNLSCRRLFWSTREPWKLVSYTITTHVLKPQTCEAVIDKNFTVDHTLPKIILDKKLKEIFLWQKDVDNANNESSETDYEEEPQNEKDADILFPELTDAILEELPRDLLDGISMQDIFPKLLSNDELLGVNNADSEQKKFLYSEETKDNKNDNFQLFNSNKISKNRNLGRSCSVTLSCKVGNPLSSSTKQIKSLSQDKSMFLQLLQVDGAYDYSSSSDSEPEDVWNADAQDEPVKCGRCQCTYRTQASYKRHLESCEVISTSESDSETPEQEQMEISHCGTVGRSISFQENPSPYTVTSYESYSSHQTIQNLQQTCINKEPVPAITQSSEIFVANFQPVVEQKFISDTISLNSQPQMSPQVVSMNQQSSLPVNQITINESNELCINQPSPLYISQSNCSSLVNHSGIQILQPQPITINRVPQTPLQINIQPSPMMNLSSSEEIQKNAILNQFLKPTQKVMVPSVNQKYAKSRGRPKTITCKRTRPIESKTYYVPPATMGAPPVVVQQLPSNNMVPTFVEAFQQQTGQNLQYITTITPQITSAVQNQPPIMHFQSDNTLLNFVSGVQPTVILPQTRVLTDSLMIDNNGSLVWAPQPTQPIFYGFETIVQNTVLQSQQFLPGTVPGVLTANSSYSSTTQVFQTSKMESVLDVTSGNILYLNSAPVVNPQPMQVPQTISSSIPTNPPLVLQESKPTVSWSYLEPPPEPLVNEKVAKPVQTFIPAVVNTNNGVHSINLPVAPFTPEPGIPTNVVPPTPKPISITSHSRPMNRVLPMPTNNPKLTIKAAPKKVILEKPNLVISKCERSLEKPKAPKIKIVDDVIIKPVVQPIVNKTETSSILAKPPLKPLKENREQNSEQIFKVNNFNSKKNAAVHIATLRPIKTKNVLNDQNIQEKPVVDAPAKEDKKSFNDKQKSAIMYTIETQDGFHYTSNSVQDLWSKVFDAVQAARLAHDMPPLPPGSFGTINNLQVLGLKSNGLKYLLEQLPGAAKCVKYKHIFHHQTPDVDVDDDFDTINHRDAIKCVPYITSNEPSDMFGWLASKHRKPPLCNFNDFEQLTRRGSIINLPMAMRFRHLKLTSKQSVGVYRSRIHKRGLFCHRDIESGEMVIEYAGEVIRSVLADKREKQYTVKGMGCYMFRIDENFVVDATMKGNAARFINHSCEPNCYSKVVEILGHKHIIIFALRKIQCAEELTYDYKFPFEEDKIPCTCGSRRCRKFLN